MKSRKQLDSFEKFINIEVENLIEFKQGSIPTIYNKSLFLATVLSLFCSTTSCATNVYVNTDVTQTPSVMVDEKPFFPFGFYYVSYYDSEQTKRLNDLRAIAQAGFNTMYVPLDLNDDSFLNESAKLGVQIIGEFNEDPMSVINKYKNNSAIIGWLVADDADNGKKTPEQLSQFNYQLKVADPQRITYLSGGYPKKIGQFVDSADVVGMQSYPVTAEPLSTVNYSIASAVKAAVPINRPVIANLQTFAWSGGRAPTPKEVRNMTYQSLINGVKGIIYYAYYDGVWNLPDNKTLWNGVKLLVPEIKQLTSTLLYGDLIKIATGVSDTYAGIWKYQNKAVVVVINTSSNATKEVTVSLPLQRTTGIETMFAGRPSGMIVKGDKLSGSIKPKDVHVYTFGY
ncbi:hypothetical protein C7Y66_14050 [Chroococcidiopsis sp. CCALA 051]|uniref:hypothetical protein n=1 Tax=Chroococcidiopsis sp. CCALA 051 TaxID=869949 RepID=UPI000D0DD479|nr:hypothetical protein [Chroococcidiopsis sp. CCALA 051]PSM48508.1 hypothetical protein C7Y66_14050 [Chroococcidiopsis sp. CCALA 051]